MQQIADKDSLEGDEDKIEKELEPEREESNVQEGSFFVNLDDIINKNQTMIEPFDIF